MANHLSETEKWFISELNKITALTAVVSSRKFNSVAPPVAKMQPYLVYKFIPLDNSKGQRGVPIQSNFLVDCIIYCEPANIAAVDNAVGAIDAHFSSTNLVRSTATVRVAISADKPISRNPSGSKPDQTIFARGTTYRIWTATLDPNI